MLYICLFDDILCFVQFDLKIFASKSIEFSVLLPSSQNPMV